MSTGFPQFPKTNKSDMFFSNESSSDKAPDSSSGVILPHKVALEFLSGKLPLSDLVALSERKFAQLTPPKWSHSARIAEIEKTIPPAFFEDFHTRGFELPDIQGIFRNQEKFNSLIKHFFEKNLGTTQSASSPIMGFYETSPENLTFKRLTKEPSKDNLSKLTIEETTEAQVPEKANDEEAEELKTVERNVKGTTEAQVPEKANDEEAEELITVERNVNGTTEAQVPEEANDEEAEELKTVERNVNWIRLIYDAPNFFKDHAVVNEERKEYFTSEENAEELKNDPAFEGYQGYTLTNEDLQNISQDFKKVFLPLFFDALNDYVASQKTTKPEEEKPSLSEVAEDLEASRNTVAKKEESKDKTAHKKTKADSTLTASLKNKEIAENKAAEANRQKIKKENIEKTLEKLQHIHITDRLHELNEQQTIDTATLTADRIKKGAAPAA